MCTPPFGDIPLESLRDSSGVNIVIWGGLPGAMFSPSTKERDFIRHAKTAVDVFSKDGRCVLGVADQVPPDGLLERVRLVSDMVR
jgi:hypothetical protein